MRKLDPYSGFAEFRRVRHKFSWLALTRPDLLAAVYILAQVMEGIHTKSHAK